VNPLVLAVQWRKENEKYIQPQDIWVWLEAAFVAGYKAKRLHHEEETMNNGPFVVITTYVDSYCLGRTLEDTRTFPDAAAAGAWIGEEIGFTDVIDIKCPALGLTIDGQAAKQAA